MSTVNKCTPEQLLKIGQETLNQLKETNQLITLYKWYSGAGIDEETLQDMSKSHSDINRLYKEYKQAQQDQLLTQGLTSKFNPIMSIFLLKAKHGYMETDKRILTGDKSAPISISIVPDTTIKDIEA
jgi:hypothetical protein